MSASPRHGLQGFSVRELSPEGQLRIISEPEYGTLKAVEAPKYKDHMADIWSRDIPLLQKIELSAKMTVFGDDPWRWNGVPDHFQQPSTFGSELRGFGKELLNMGLTALDVVTGYSGLAPQFSISPSEINGANAAKMLPVVGIFGRASKAGGAVNVSGINGAKNPRLFENQFPGHSIDMPNIIPNSRLKDINGQFNYVVSENGALIVGRKGQFPGGGHIDLAAGAPVRAAGEVRVVNGKIKHIDNSSGHYLPSGVNAHRSAEQAFYSIGFDIKGKYLEKSWVPDPTLQRKGTWRAVP